MPEDRVIYEDRQPLSHQMKSRCISTDAHSPVHEDNEMDNRRYTNDEMAVCVSRLERWKPERRTASFRGLYEPIQEADGTSLAEVVVCTLCSVISSKFATALCKQTKGINVHAKALLKAVHYVVRIHTITKNQYSPPSYLYTIFWP